MKKDARQAKYNDIAMMAYCIASEVLMGKYPKKAEQKHQEATGILEEMARKEIPFPVFKRINFTLEEILARLEETQTALCLYDGMKSFFSSVRRAPSAPPEEAGRCRELREAVNREAAELKMLVQPEFQEYIDRYLSAVLAEQEYKVACFRNLLFSMLKDLRDFAEETRPES